jgi:hypothetical protein
MFTLTCGIQNALAFEKAPNNFLATYPQSGP